MNKTTMLTISAILSFCGIFASKVGAWENELTHPAITQKAVDNSVLNDFIKNQLGFSAGLGTQLELTELYRNNMIRRASQANPWKTWDNVEISILDLFTEGSKYEDIPNPRARHHFYDPIRNTGLNNSDADPYILSAIQIGSLWFYPDYWGFDATGLGTLDRAKGTKI